MSREEATCLSKNPTMSSPQNLSKSESERRKRRDQKGEEKQYFSIMDTILFSSPERRGRSATSSSWIWSMRSVASASDSGLEEEEEKERSNKQS